MGPVLSVRVLPGGPEMTLAGRPEGVAVGRDPAADVVLPDSCVSRRHAVVRLGGDGRWVWEDLSSGGTFRGAERVARLVIDQPVVVRLGHPRIGPELRLAVGAAAGGAATGERGGAVGPSMPQAPGRIGRAEWAGSVGVGSVGAGSVGLARPSQLYEPASRTRIGRADDNDIVIADLLVSRHHAELRAAGAGYEIVDLDSHNGTYVDGRRIKGRAAVHEGAVVSVGHHLFRLWQGQLEEYVDVGMATFAARDLVVAVNQRRLLDDVSFSLDAGHFLAVLGPTGAGKSTLIKALIGIHPADGGRVLYNGRDLYASYAELRNRIGYVPQDDVLHQQLTVRSVLEYAAELRFPPDVPASERLHRVEEVMADLGLTQRAGLAVSRLSGGQRKRTSMAIEMLTRPSLLVLDEPTSGLDPGYEKSVMHLLRDLADGGRTIVAATHSTQSLDRCDRLLFLAPGGQTAYFGPPDEALGWFGKADYADVFQYLDQAPEGVAKAAFAGSPAEERYVASPLALPGANLAPGAVAAAAGGFGAVGSGAGGGSGAGWAAGGGSGAGWAAPSPAATKRAAWGKQFVTLTRRYLSVLTADRRNTLLLVLQAPILGLLMMAVFGHDNLVATNPGSRLSAPTVLVGLILGATYLGASNSIREIVKERGILERDRAIGTSASAYVASKVVVLGGVTLVQAAILLVFGIARQGSLGPGAVLHSAVIELYIVVALTGLAAMALGLLISALVSNADKALTILPVILFAQFLLTGAVFNLSHTAGINQLGYLSSARWGYSAAASTVNPDQIQRRGCNGTFTPAPVPAPARSCDPLHRHSAGTWGGDVGALVGLGVASAAGAWWALVPLGQPRRRRARATRLEVGVPPG